MVAHSPLSRREDVAILVEGEWTLPALRAAAGMCEVKFSLYNIPAGGGCSGQSWTRLLAWRGGRGRGSGPSSPAFPHPLERPAGFLISLSVHFSSVYSKAKNFVS